MNTACLALFISVWWMVFGDVNTADVSTALDLSLFVIVASFVRDAICGIIACMKRRSEKEKP